MSRKHACFVPSPVPADIGIGLLDWLRREFVNIANALTNYQLNMMVMHEPPERLEEGMLRYADGTDWNPGSGKGVYVYTGTAWVKL